jgi:hypothetical protein
MGYMSRPMMHGPVDIFNEKQRGVYNQMIADSLDVTLSKKQRQIKKDTAVLKMKRTDAKRKEDAGDEDAKATNDKHREKDRVQSSLRNTDAKRKRKDGDPKAVAAYAIKLEKSSILDASNKVARLAGDPKACAAYAIKLEQCSIRNEANRQALHDGDPEALAAYDIHLEQNKIRKQQTKWARLSLLFAGHSDAEEEEVRYTES